MAVDLVGVGGQGCLPKREPEPRSLRTLQDQPLDARSAGMRAQAPEVRPGTLGVGED